MDTAKIPTAAAETVIATILRASDPLWGGFMNVHLTNRRIVVESVMKSAATAAAFAAGGIVGALIAQNVAGKKAQDMQSQKKTIDEILASSDKNYAILHEDISALVLKRKALPIGCSRLKIVSRTKKITYAFKRELFDEVAAALNSLLPGRTTLK